MQILLGRKVRDKISFQDNVSKQWWSHFTREGEWKKALWPLLILSFKRLGCLLPYPSNYPRSPSNDNIWCKLLIYFFVALHEYSLTEAILPNFGWKLVGAWFQRLSDIHGDTHTHTHTLHINTHTHTYRIRMDGLK